MSNFTGGINLADVLPSNLPDTNVAMTQYYDALQEATRDTHEEPTEPHVRSTVMSELIKDKYLTSYEWSLMSLETALSLKTRSCLTEAGLRAVLLSFDGLEPAIQTGIAVDIRRRESGVEYVHGSMFIEPADSPRTVGREVKARGGKIPKTSELGPEEPLPPLFQLLRSGGQYQIRVNEACSERLPDGIDEVYTTFTGPEGLGIYLATLTAEAARRRGRQVNWDESKTIPRITPRTDILG